MDSETQTRTPGGASARLRWYERLRQSQTLVPTFAVVTVVVAAVAATVVVVTQSDGQEGGRPPVLSSGSQDVVRAPAPVVRAPPLKEPAERADTARRRSAEAASSAMGAGPACRNCGVVESVAAVNQGGYRMRIRMDDGTVRTIRQRGALAAGSRVLLEGGSVRAMPAATRQG